MKNYFPGISRTKHTLFFVILFVFSIQYAHNQEIYFNKTPLPKGDNVEFITGITQDANGIMWFSTKAGVLSYDGNNTAIYKNNPINPNSLVSNFTESVFADEGKIWVGTLGHGLDLFEPASGTFTHFKHDPNDPNSLSNDTVTDILKDSQGVLWIGTHGGLNQFDPETRQFIHYHSDENDPSTLSHDQVRVLYEDRQGTLWVGTGSPYADNGGGPLAGGLNQMNTKTKKFIRYKHKPDNDNSLLNNKITAIYEDDQGVLWIGTARNGLHRMNRENGNFERLIYDPARPEKFGSPPITEETLDYEHITFITQDGIGNYWFGTTQSGIYYLNTQLGKTAHFQNNDNPLFGFTDEGAWHAFTSREGMLWIGGINGNIYRVNPDQKEIPHYPTPSPVNGFYEEPNGNLWIATDQKIIKKEKSNGDFKQMEIDLTPNNMEDDFVQFIEEDSEGNIWIGGSGGLGLWDHKNEKLIHYKHDPNNRQSLSNNGLIKIYEDKQKNLWIGSIDGINLMDRKKGTFKKHYLNRIDTSFIGLNVVTSILEDNLNNLWVGTWNGSGVYLFDRQTKTSKVYLSGTNIVCLFEDADKVMWLGSNYGLFRYDPKEDNFVRYLDPFTMNGISFVFGIAEDNDKYLWVSSNSGLFRINPERNETNKLSKAYGLGNSEFQWKASYKGRDGKLYFGDDRGYYAFDPHEIFTDTLRPEIALTGFRLADQSIKPTDNGPLKQNLDIATEIVLDYNQNVFSFDYAIIDYVNPEENQLTYTLENYDNNWLQPNSDRRAYYFNIPPGKYTFRLKGANSYGIWAEKKIKITILPPWWKTYWAYGGYALLFLLIVFGFDRIQRRRIQMIERQKAYKRELAQAKEIEKAYKELKTTQTQLIQSEKMASLGELTAGIAHEIQNPLNFVNNFSEVNTELIIELKEEIEKGDKQESLSIANDIADNEQKIVHHGKRADAIVKAMLQHSRSSGNEKIPVDINALADEYLRLSYHGLRAKDKNFNADFKTDLDEKLPKINVIPQDIGRVLLNLINNAFYAVDKKTKENINGYKPKVIVITEKLNDKVKISVKDNGNGIPDEVKDKIFQPFFTTKPTGEGTGLGLSMSYDIITKGHGGTLEVNTHEGIGTEFIINLNI
jgi:ligand-binding sensor domain-containing protein/signal transduction histidine kinase